MLSRRRTPTSSHWTSHYHWTPTLSTWCSCTALLYSRPQTAFHTGLPSPRPAELACRTPPSFPISPANILDILAYDELW